MVEGGLDSSRSRRRVTSTYRERKEWKDEEGGGKDEGVFLSFFFPFKKVKRKEEGSE